MKTAIYPGTFDPPHLGHLDLIERGRALVDELVVAVAMNVDKQSVFSPPERVDLIEQCTRDWPDVRVIEFKGLVVDLVRSENAQCILRGIRTLSDFEAEIGMALTNRQLAGDEAGETIFVLPKLEYSHYSSRRVKEVASFGGPVASFLPDAIRDRVEERLTERFGSGS